MSAYLISIIWIMGGLYETMVELEGSAASLMVLTEKPPRLFKSLRIDLCCMDCCDIFCLPL